jgi:PAS domain S-box-containing protein
MRVLIIEDNDIDFRLVERALGEEFILTRAKTLKTGLAVATANRFDLVILDLGLDDSFGYPTFEKAQAALDRVPILILSGFADDEMAVRAVANGAQDFVNKSSLLSHPLDKSARYAVERRRVEEVARKAELRFGALIESLPIASFICDQEGRINCYNQKAVEIWGRSPDLNDSNERFSGSYKRFTETGEPISREQSPTGRAFTERRPVVGQEMTIEKPDGQRRIVLSYATPLTDGDGNFGGVITAFLDVTRERQAERRLRDSERLVRSTLNSLPAGIAILDQSGTILCANSAWPDFAIGQSVDTDESVVGKNYLGVCDVSAAAGVDHAAATAAGIRAILRSESTGFELEYPCHSPGREMWVLVRATPFEGDGAKRVVVSHEDVTTRKTAERLAREQDGLRQAVAGMEHVLGVVGHELRTPLAALRAISEFLTSDGTTDTPEAKRFLHEISQEVDRMSDTVNNLLEAARLNSGRARWNWSRIDLAEVVDDAVSSVRTLIDTDRIGLRYDIDPADAAMLGDAEAIRRLLVNFLGNARKHTTAGEIRVAVKRHAESDGDWVRLTVSDTGSGIPPELVCRLGEAFALNSGVVGSNYVGGTGLGLAICKGIAAAHGGDIRIESTPGRGTTVVARIRADLHAAAVGDTVWVETFAEVAA